MFDAVGFWYTELHVRTHERDDAYRLFNARTQAMGFLIIDTVKALRALDKVKHWIEELTDPEKLASNSAEWRESILGCVQNELFRIQGVVHIIMQNQHERCAFLDCIRIRLLIR